MGNFTRKPAQTLKEENKFAELGFRRNPFPIDPTVKPNSKDERENGSIFLKELRNFEFEQFKDKVINEPNKINLLMDYAAYRGRGIGKTAFLNYQKNQINSDFGDSISSGKQVLYSLYITPAADKKERKFWQLARTIYDAIMQEELLLIAFCRIRALSGLINEEILTEINTNNLAETLANDNWLKEKGINIPQLNDYMTDVFQKEGITFRIALEGLFSNTYNESFLKQIHTENTDSFWRNKGMDLVFDTIIRIFKTAEFSNCIILFDEAEKIITTQNFSERREFCDNLRYYFIDGSSLNAHISFYKILMTIHPNSQELLLTHWNAAGLDRFSELGGEKAERNTIFFHPLENVNAAYSLAKIYLKAARINESNEDDLKPFTELSLELAITKSEGIPGKYLKLLYSVMENAANEGLSEITESDMEKIWKTQVTIDATKKDPGNVLPNTKINLK